MASTISKFVAPALLTLASVVAGLFAQAAHHEYGRLHALAWSSSKTQLLHVSPEPYFQKALWLSGITLIVLAVTIWGFVKIRSLPWFLAVIVCMFIAGLAMTHAGVRY